MFSVLVVRSVARIHVPGHADVQSLPVGWTAPTRVALLRDSMDVQYADAPVLQLKSRRRSTATWSTASRLNATMLSRRRDSAVQFAQLRHHSTALSSDALLLIVTTTMFLRDSAAQCARRSTVQRCCVCDQCAPMDLSQSLHRDNVVQSAQHLVRQSLPWPLYHQPQRARRTKSTRNVKVVHVNLRARVQSTVLCAVLDVDARPATSSSSPMGHVCQRKTAHLAARMRNTSNAVAHASQHVAAPSCARLASLDVLARLATSSGQPMARVFPRNSAQAAQPMQSTRVVEVFARQHAPLVSGVEHAVQDVHVNEVTSWRVQMDDASRRRRAQGVVTNHAAGVYHSAAGEASQDCTAATASAVQCVITDDVGIAGLPAEMDAAFPAVAKLAEMDDAYTADDDRELAEMDDVFPAVAELAEMGCANTVAADLAKKDAVSPTTAEFAEMDAASIAATELAAMDVASAADVEVASYALVTDAVLDAMGGVDPVPTDMHASIYPPAPTLPIPLQLRDIYLLLSDTNLLALSITWH
ncbi:uncharacterized protein LOC135819324 isoform X2 [Sycon ciliatum]|uniref:uncharacterized protein LOC135819324 isoform X2 n=1 Tax=Sycon ciliatum TaxID=27933 RepID=UPI0031F61B50